MENIQFAYEVISVDNENKTMTVRYSAVNYPSVEEILPFPILPVTVEEVIRTSAPFGRWRSLSNQYSLPNVGISGSGQETNTVTVVLKPI